MTRIRQLMPVHFFSVMAIEKKVFSDAWSWSLMAAMFIEAYETSRVIIHNGKLCGYLIALKSKTALHIVNIAVHPDFQGHGFGKRLLSVSPGIAQKAVCETLMLEVRPSNTRALVLYEKFGFFIMNRRRHYYADNEDAYVMIKPLSFD